LGSTVGNDTTQLALTDSITMNVIQPGDPDTCCDTYYYTDYYAYVYSIVNGTLTRRADISNVPLPALDAQILPGQINSDGSTDLLVLWADNNLAWGYVKGFTLTTCPNFNTPDKVELLDFDGDGLDEVFVLKAMAYTIYI